MAAPKGPRPVKQLQNLVKRLRQHDLPDASWPVLDQMDEILGEMDGSTGKSDNDRKPAKRAKVASKRKLPVRRG